MIRARTHTALAPATALAMLIAIAPAQADEKAKALTQKVQNTYKNLDQLQSQTNIEIKMVANNGQTRKRNAEQALAFDRKNDRLRIDSSGTVLTIDQGTLKLNINQHKKHHLEKQAPSPITYAATKKAVPRLLERATLPEFAMMTEKDPIAAIAGDEKASATLVELDGQAKGLQFEAQRGTITLHIDPENHMIDKTVQSIEVDDQRSPVKSVTVTYDHTLKSKNESLDEATFALDTKNSKAVKSMDALIEKVRGERGGQGKHALQGKKAPNFTLKNLAGESVALNKEKADVVILDFWASWCGPCKRALPKLQNVHDWANENDKSVAVYAVNVKESKNKAKQYWDEQGFSIPVLLDADGKVSQKYKVRGIPQTVLIANGKVKSVHVGYSADIDKTLKSEIQAAMNE